MTPSIESIKQAVKRDYVAELHEVQSEINALREARRFETDEFTRKRTLRRIMKLQLQRSIILDQLRSSL